MLMAILVSGVDRTFKCFTKNRICREVVSEHGEDGGEFRFEVT